MFRSILLASAKARRPGGVAANGRPYTYQAISPTTQSVMAIHAWRSINVARRAIHRPGFDLIGL